MESVNWSFLHLVMGHGHLISACIVRQRERDPCRRNQAHNKQPALVNHGDAPQVLLAAAAATQEAERDVAATPEADGSRGLAGSRFVPSLQ
jgi:hypothetical protein